MLAGCPNWKDFADKSLRCLVGSGKFSYSQFDQISHLHPRVKLSLARTLANEHNGHREPAKRPLAEVGLFHEAQHFGIEAQGLVLVVDVHAGQFDFHRFPCVAAFAGAARHYFFLFVSVD